MVSKARKAQRKNEPRCGNRPSIVPEKMPVLTLFVAPEPGIICGNGLIGGGGGGGERCRKNNSNNNRSQWCGYKGCEGTVAETAILREAPEGLVERPLSHSAISSRRIPRP